MQHAELSQGIDFLLNWCRTHFGTRRLRDITWAHAVNSKKLLQEALLQQAVMIEADVSAGADGNIIMAHSADDWSDLTLQEMLLAVRDAPMPVKLDFKDPVALPAALSLLKEAHLAQPVILNADVVEGPGHRRTLWDAGGFIEMCRAEYPAALISPGWTTTSDRGEGYTQEQIEAMLHACREIGSAAFPVRANLLPQSHDAVMLLLKRPGAVLSLWSNHPLTNEAAAWIKLHLAETDYLFDVPAGTLSDLEQNLL
jgi:hypothetical protein